MKLATTFGGAGVVHGDLTPECAGAGRPRCWMPCPPRLPKDDDRTRDQRYHDALTRGDEPADAASGLLPERAGQPVRAWAHISLADLLLLDGDSALQEEWTAQVRERWAASRAGRPRAAARTAPGWTGRTPKAIACDAAMAPIVTGDVNVDALEDLVRLCVELEGDARQRDGAAENAAWAALEQAVIGKAVDLLAAGRLAAARVRRRRLVVRLAGPSLPLDIGYAETIPAGIRNAVLLRDRHCQGIGPAAAASPPGPARCTTRSTRPTAARPRVKDCVLLCRFHHQVVIHRWGWTLVVNPDGTTTAWNKDKTKVLHSHGPPARAG